MVGMVMEALRHHDFGLWWAVVIIGRNLCELHQVTKDVIYLLYGLKRRLLAFRLQKNTKDITSNQYYLSTCAPIK